MGFISFLQNILTDRDLSWVSKKKTRLFTGHPCEWTSGGDDDSQISWLSDLMSDSILNSVCRTPFSYHYSSVVKSWYLLTPAPLKTQSIFWFVFLSININQKGSVRTKPWCDFQMWLESYFLEKLLIDLIH